MAELPSILKFQKKAKHVHDHVYAEKIRKT
jgi:hypothetical protein